MKNKFKRLTLFILTFSVLLVLAACNGNNQNTPTGGNEQNPPANNGQYSDVIETPTDIPPLSYLEYVKYPEKPNMEAGQGSGMPTIGTATTDSEYYKIAQEGEKITVTFHGADRWDYIFLPISNFNKEYQNIKITATASNIQKISVTALYLEMYDEGHPAVTTLLHDVGDTEQFYIMELGKNKLLDESYYPLDAVLGDQTVFGICIFLDSNPSQQILNKNDEIESKFEISSVEFLKDGDEALKDRYVAPSLSVGYVDPGYIATKNEETKEYTITKDASASKWESASLNVSNYSSEYSAFNLEFTTTGVKNFTIELSISGGQADWAPSVTVYKATNLTDGKHEAYIDFSSTQPTSQVTWAPVPGYYIKNYKITAIKIYLDTADETEVVDHEGICVVNSVEFERLASEGTTISKGWAAGSGNITLGSDLAVGGVGTVSINWYNSWEYLTIPVLNYETAEKLVIKFQANEGLDYMGIGLGCASFPQGEAILKSCWYKIGTVEEKANEFEGIEETVEYDEANKIYTITFDFTDAVGVEKYQGKRLNEMLITSLRFYFTDPNSKAVFEGQRTVRFISISFE